MSKAIGLRIVPYDEKKHLKSHFFGKPLATPSMKGEFDDTVLFLCMIHLTEIAKFDKENKLPHEGYLYFFLDTANTYRQMQPIVRYVKEEPTEIIDDFNAKLAKGQLKGIEEPRGIEFAEVEENDDGCKLLGVPCDWNYQAKPKPLLLQISHFDEELDFLPELDGFTYVFFGPEDAPFDGATGFCEYS